MKSKRKGDCYKVAGRLTVIEEVGTLCHGTVVGTGGEVKGLRYGHAWVEVPADGTVLVIDKSNGRDLAIPRDFYYQMGNVEDVVRYTRFEAAQQMCQHKHWGPWPC